MNLKMGNQTFANVQVPLLWGKRAVVLDSKNRLSVINLSGSIAKLEIVGDKPAPGIEFVPVSEGFVIKEDGKELYSFNPQEKLLKAIELKLPPCQISDIDIKIGGSVFSGNMVMGFGVGIVVDENGMSMGAPLPPGLAKLVI
jgi:hypothetical protein